MRLSLLQQRMRLRRLMLLLIPELNQQRALGFSGVNRLVLIYVVSIIRHNLIANRLRVTTLLSGLLIKDYSKSNCALH
jgi:hypothetical protein